MLKQLNPRFPESTLCEYDTIVHSANINQNGDMRKAEVIEREAGNVSLNVDES